MRTLKHLSLNTLKIAADADMGTAMIAMQKSGAGALAVEREGEFIGFVTIESAILSDPETPVTDFLRGTSLEVQEDDFVRVVAKKFVQSRADYLPVFRDQEYVGLLSSLDLITELGRSYDPLTGLSWSDALREWGVDRLEIGQEICIVFFDLNDFGRYNKQHGHIVGDHVLQGFAELLRQLVNDRKDLLVRYGGDEFALATTRSREEIDAILLQLEPRQFNISDVPEPVGFSYGISGGKRTNEPSRAHVAATLDNLISLASKDCLARKPGKKAEPLVLELHSQATYDSEPEIDWRDVAIKAATDASRASSARITIIDTFFVQSTESERRVVVCGTTTISGKERTFESERQIGASLRQSIEEAVWEGALLS
jgi:diguanylate cyclase (GGDEF)-like protein